MSFLKKLFTIGNRTLARTIAKDFAEIYIQVRDKNTHQTSIDLIKKTLSKLDLPAAQELLKDQSFWQDSNNTDLEFVVYLLVTESSPINKKKLFLPSGNAEAYIEEINWY